LVCITESEQTYKSPQPSISSSSTTNLTVQHPLLNIRRIRSMEIIALPSCIHQHIPEDFIMQQREDKKRQLGLLRQSFKEHDFYFVPPTSSSNLGENDLTVVSDITHTLQRSFVYWIEEERKRKQGSLEVNDSLKTKENVAQRGTVNNINETDNILGQKENKTDSPTQDKHSWWFPLFTKFSSVSSNDSHFDGRSPDSRFLWNEEGVRPFLEHMTPNVSNNKSSLFRTLANHVIPVTSAFIGVQRQIALAPDAVRNTPYSVLYDQLLISRRSKYRAGTRFTRRGSDRWGDVANYAETEQICIIFDNLEGHTKTDENATVNQALVEKQNVREIYSHVQTRGSIPLRWSSPADVKTYRPRVLIGTDPLAQARSLRNHILEQLSIYSTPYQFINNHEKHKDLLFVNLIDKHSDQGRLGRTFDAVLNAVLDVYHDHCDIKEEIQVHSSLDQGQNLKPELLSPTAIGHKWFDFHAECSGGRWGKLQKLLDYVAPVLDSQGYFCVVSHVASEGSQACLWKILSFQRGIVRTNCMDCLDR